MKISFIETKKGCLIKVTLSQQTIWYNTLKISKLYNYSLNDRITWPNNKLHKQHIAAEFAFPVRTVVHKALEFFPAFILLLYSCSIVLANYAILANTTTDMSYLLVVHFQQNVYKLFLWSPGHNYCVNW